MLSVAQLKKMISEGEGFVVEFKKNSDRLSADVFETVASFSNRYGGHIILGVSDNGEILGVNRNTVEGMKKNFVNQLNNPEFMVPSLFLNLEEIEVDGKLLLYTYIPVASQMVMMGTKIFDRAEDADLDIGRSVDLVANLARRKSNAFTERELFPYVTEKELRIEELMPKVRNRTRRIPNHPWIEMSDMEIMKSAGLYEDDWRMGRKGYNLAAILLFGRDEVIRSCTPNYLTDAIFRDKNPDRYDDRLVVTSNLILAYSTLMDFIAKHTNDKFFLLGDRRVSVRDLIAHEIVSNSLAHRDYASAFPAKIVVEKDKIWSENWNRAQRVGDIDPESFKPYPKNPLIAMFFTNIGYADQLGSGVRNLFKYTRIYSGCDPKLIEDDVFKTIVPFATGVVNDDIGVVNNGNGVANTELNDTEKNRREASGKRRGKTGGKQAENRRKTGGILTTNDEKFFKQLEPHLSKGEWITAKMVEEIIGKSNSIAKGLLARLVSARLLEADGTTKGKRYRPLN